MPECKKPPSEINHKTKTVLVDSVLNSFRKKAIYSVKEQIRGNCLFVLLCTHRTHVIWSPLLDSFSCPERPLGFPHPSKVPGVLLQAMPKCTQIFLTVKTNHHPSLQLSSLIQEHVEVRVELDTITFFYRKLIDAASNLRDKSTMPTSMSSLLFLDKYAV